jgi:hypothetical protein
MEKAASVFLYLAGISFLSVGIYLLHKASRTGGIPERYLGLAFLCNGISYGFSEVPFVFGVEHLVDEMSFIGRIFAAGCTISIAVFTYRVFRPTARWAVRLVWIDAAAIVCGLAVSAFEGDWGGLAPLTSKGFWIEWGASIVPYIWLAVEALGRYSVSRERVLLGLMDPLLSNRFFLVGLYGALASSTYLVMLFMYIGYERNGSWSPALDTALGVVETVSVLALWVSFRAPNFYRRWVGSAEAPTP